jgi:hypothetical protein
MSPTLPAYDCSSQYHFISVTYTTAYLPINCISPYYLQDGPTKIKMEQEKDAIHNLCAAYKIQSDQGLLDIANYFAKNLASGDVMWKEVPKCVRFILGSLRASDIPNDVDLDLAKGAPPMVVNDASNVKRKFALVIPNPYYPLLDALLLIFPSFPVGSSRQTGSTYTGSITCSPTQVPASQHTIDQLMKALNTAGSSSKDYLLNEFREDEFRAQERLAMVNSEITLFVQNNAGHKPVSTKMKSWMIREGVAVPANMSLAQEIMDDWKAQQSSKQRFSTPSPAKSTRSTPSKSPAKDFNNML